MIFMGMGPLPRFICYPVNSLNRSNAVCNTMEVDEALYKSTGGSFGRSIERRKGKSISRVTVYSGRNKVLLFLG